MGTHWGDKDDPDKDLLPGCSLVLAAWFALSVGGIYLAAQVVRAVYRARTGL